MKTPVERTEGQTQFRFLTNTVFGTIAAAKHAAREQDRRMKEKGRSI
jgi:hypothetical protein